MTHIKLIELLKVPHGKVEQEDNVREYIKQQVPGINQDEHGNLYLLNKNTPVFCAHMDNVGSAEAQKHLKKIKMDKVGIIKGTHNMGADDKVGIYICLEMYRKFGDKVSLLFTIGEEIGGVGASAFDKELLKDNTYCVIPDRYGTSDIISSHNSYCTEEFESVVASHLKDFGFLPAPGVWCDADVLHTYLNCINISCGYYHHHTDNEYVDYIATSNTIKALEHLVSQDIPRMTPEEGDRRGSYRGSMYDPSYGYDDYEQSILSRGGIIYNEDTGEQIDLSPGHWTYISTAEEDDDFISSLHGRGQ